MGEMDKRPVDDSEDFGGDFYFWSLTLMKELRAQQSKKDNSSATERTNDLLLFSKSHSRRRWPPSPRAILKLQKVMTQ